MSENAGKSDTLTLIENRVISIHEKVGSVVTAFDDQKRRLADLERAVRDANRDMQAFKDQVTRELQSIKEFHTQDVARIREHAARELQSYKDTIGAKHTEIDLRVGAIATQASLLDRRQEKSNSRTWEIIMKMAPTVAQLAGLGLVYALLKGGAIP